MKKLIKKNLTFLVLFFTFLTVSASDDKVSEKTYLYKFLHQGKSQVSQLYKISAFAQTENYLFLEFDSIRPEDSTNFKNTCYLKTVLSPKDMEDLSKFAMLVFSIQDITYDSKKEPIDPVAPLPAPLPFYEEPIDPVAPLPAPLPFYEEPIDPVAPLPAPLPFYEEPEYPYSTRAGKKVESEQVPSLQITPSGFIIRNRGDEGSFEKTILKPEQLSWSNNIESVLGSDFPLIEGCEE